MHQCLKCGKLISDLAEIQDGCSCGSQVFIYKKSEEDIREKPSFRKTRVSVMDFGAGEKSQTPQAPATLPKIPQDASGKAPANEKDFGLAEPAKAPGAGQNVFADGKYSGGKAPANEKDFGLAEPAKAPAAGENVFDNEKYSGSNGAANAGDGKYSGGNEARGEKDLADKAAAGASTEENGDWQEIWLSKKAEIWAAGDGDLENIRQLRKGVYEVDFKGLSDGNPVVVKDEEGIYYVRLPFTEVTLPAKRQAKP